MAQSVLYTLYERRLLAEIENLPIPKHIGVILDGNRRWARSIGSDAVHGHRTGADKIFEFLGWSQDVGVEVVTLWMLSTENMARESSELTDLLEIICDTVERLARAQRWDLRLVGATEVLPAQVRERLNRAIATSTTARPQRVGDAPAMTSPTYGAKQAKRMIVNIAVGYGGRREIADAVKSLLRERAQQGDTLEHVAQTLTEEDITAHMYTSGLPDPDLLIRTSGEQRLSGFLLWQSAYSEFYFCEAYWPEFRFVDFLRALRSYGTRERRMGK